VNPTKKKAANQPNSTKETKISEKLRSATIPKCQFRTYNSNKKLTIPNIQTIKDFIEKTDPKNDQKIVQKRCQKTMPKNGQKSTLKIVKIIT
jgi:hypothetical protein